MVSYYRKSGRLTPEFPVDRTLFTSGIGEVRFQKGVWQKAGFSCGSKWSDSFDGSQGMGLTQLLPEFMDNEGGHIIYINFLLAGHKPARGIQLLIA